jgi:chitodextrinase
MILKRLAALAIVLTGATALAVPAEAAGTDTQPPSTPGRLTIVAVTSTTIQLRWDPSTDNVGVTGYDILRAQGRQSHRLRGTVAGTTYTDTGLVSQVTYSYYVRARDAAGNRSTLSNGVTAVTLPG